MESREEKKGKRESRITPFPSKEGKGKKMGKRSLHYFILLRQGRGKIKKGPAAKKGEKRGGRGPVTYCFGDKKSRSFLAKGGGGSRKGGEGHEKSSSDTL